MQHTLPRSGSLEASHQRPGSTERLDLSRRFQRKTEPMVGKGVLMAGADMGSLHRRPSCAWGWEGLQAAGAPCPPTGCTSPVVRGWDGCGDPTHAGGHRVRHRYSPPNVGGCSGAPSTPTHVTTTHHGSPGRSRTGLNVMPLLPSLNRAGRCLHPGLEGSKARPVHRACVSNDPPTATAATAVVHQRTGSFHAGFVSLDGWTASGALPSTHAMVPLRCSARWMDGTAWEWRAMPRKWFNMGFMMTES